MRNIIGLASAGLTAALLLSACSQAQTEPDRGTTHEDALETRAANLKVLYVAADGFAYKDDKGELTGVTVEIMRDFVTWFERYNAVDVDLEFVEEADWSHFYDRVSEAEGGVFGLGNVTITEARWNELAFSPPYMDNVATLITPASQREATNTEELTEVLGDLTPLGFAGTLHEQRVRELVQQLELNQEVSLAESNPEIIERVAAGEHWAYIDAYNFWRASDEGAAIRQHETFSESDEQFGIIMPHNNDWQTSLTAFFAAESGYRNTDRYASLLREHLGEELAAILLTAGD